jgi:cytochrome d ubiquinol oxidase subunit II
MAISKAAAGPYALRVGLLWWAFGMCLALIYFVVVYRMFRGKITVTSSEYGD